MAMPNTPVPNSTPSRKKTTPGWFSLLIILAAIVAALVLTGIAWNQSAGQTLAPTTTPVSGQLTSTPTSLPAGTNGVDETTGIILAGAFLVLIVLGGTLGATRRKS
jgi:hypothetical protein